MATCTAPSAVGSAVAVGMTTTDAASFLPLQDTDKGIPFFRQDTLTPSHATG